ESARLNTPSRSQRTNGYTNVGYRAEVGPELLRRPSFRRRMEQVSGVAFLGFAANLLLAERA
ncbi:hypothetical protein ACWEQ8_43140, partial [Streptomyces noursei]